MNKEKILVTRSSMPKYEEYIEAIKPLWESHWITNMGAYHKQLEEGLKDYLEVPEVSLMVNGHMALEMTIQAFGFPENSEVITTPFTFISTTHAIARNHLTPVFCDVKESDGTIDENEIEKLITKKTVAIIPVHVYGNICNIEKIQEIANEYNLKVIYDAAHAFGEKYKGVSIANFGDASVFSFHATKVFNTIEGGAATFRNRELYEKIYNLKNFGIHGEEVVETIGANAKMNEFSAVMGLCNLKHIDAVIAKRRLLYNQYVRRIGDIANIRIVKNNDIDVMQTYGYMPILIEHNGGELRDLLYDFLKEKNIYSRKYFYPLTCSHDCYYRERLRAVVPVAEKLAQHVLCLPLFEEMQIEQVDYIVNLIREFLEVY